MRAAGTAVKATLVSARSPAHNAESWLDSPVERVANVISEPEAT